MCNIIGWGFQDMDCVSHTTKMHMYVGLKWPLIRPQAFQKARAFELSLFSQTLYSEGENS